MPNIETYKVYESEGMLGKASAGWLMKWKTDNIWLKSPGILMDTYMYDSYAEIISSAVIQDLGISRALRYEPSILEVYDDISNTSTNKVNRVFACKSTDYTQKDYKEITLSKLIGLNILSKKHYFGYRGYTELIKEIEEAFKLNIQDYLEDMLIIDSLILNVDRNLWNISILLDKKAQGKECLIYDFGCSFGLHTYNSGEFIDEVKYANGFQALPFDSSFEDQLSYIRDLSRYNSSSLDNTYKILSYLQNNFTDTHNTYNIQNPLTESQLEFVKSLIEQRHKVVFK